MIFWISLKSIVTFILLNSGFLFSFLLMSLSIFYFSQRTNFVWLTLDTVIVVSVALILLLYITFLVINNIWFLTSFCLFKNCGHYLGYLFEFFLMFKKINTHSHEIPFRTSLAMPQRFWWAVLSFTFDSKNFLFSVLIFFPETY